MKINTTAFLIRSLISTLFFLFTITSHAQDCPEGLILFNQDDINSFVENYPNCKEIQGSLIISQDSEEPLSLSLLKNLTTINGNCYIYFTNNLINLEGLENIESISGRLWIYKNDLLEDIQQFRSLTSVGIIDIGPNPKLIELSGFDELTHINEHLQITEGSIELIDGFNKLKYVGDYLYIDNNDSLRHISGFRELEVIDGNLTIESLDKLSNLSGFTSLHTIGENLNIFWSHGLESLSGLNCLRYVGGDINMNSNIFLKNLDGLNGLNGQGIEELIIKSNLELRSLKGLGDSEFGNLQYLEIRWNTKMRSCATRGICDFILKNPGVARIEFNEEGCNSEDEIREECEAKFWSNDEVNLSTLVFPNPASDYIHIDIIGYVEDYIEYEIFSPQGSQLSGTIKDDCSVNISQLTAGVYFIKFSTQVETTMVKFMKI